MGFKIINMSVTQCEDYTRKQLEDDCIIISINEVRGSMSNLAFNSKVKDILRLRFDDIEPKVVERLVKTNKAEREYILFTKEMALLIKDFINMWVNKGINKIIVHCAAGVSRSGAVACTLSRYYNGSDISYFSKGCVYPNELVYELMCKALDLNFNLKELKRLKRYSAKVASSKFRMNKGYVGLC